MLPRGSLSLHYLAHVSELGDLYDTDLDLAQCVTPEDLAWDLDGLE